MGVNILSKINPRPPDNCCSCFYLCFGDAKGEVTGNLIDLNTIDFSFYSHFKNPS